MRVLVNKTLAFAKFDAPLYCTVSGSYHLLPDAVHVELLDGDGLPIEVAGAPGRVVASGLVRGRLLPVRARACRGAFEERTTELASERARLRHMHGRS